MEEFRRPERQTGEDAENRKDFEKGKCEERRGGRKIEK